MRRAENQNADENEHDANFPAGRIRSTTGRAAVRRTAEPTRETDLAIILHGTCPVFNLTAAASASFWVSHSLSSPRTE